ncbi:MAG: hypothetical protein ACFFE4_10950 [Candidatus Thorarchaeota archaeon]
MSKVKRKGGPLRIPTLEEGTPKFIIIDLIEVLLPLINIILAIVFIFEITNFYVQLLLFFMLGVTIAFFFSLSIELWQIFYKKFSPIEKSILIYNSANVSPYVLYTEQFFYGYFFLSFIFLGYIEAVSVLSIFVWLYFGFSTLFLVFGIWAIVAYVNEAGGIKEDLKKNILENLNKHKNTENYAAQSYYLQLLIKVMETPIMKAGFISKLITLITILLTIVPFIIPA